MRRASSADAGNGDLPLTGSQSRIRKLSLATLAATVALITAGALVRASGSGLGCPDWPRCHGRLIPPAQAHSIIEYAHRLAVPIAGGFVLALALYAWVRFRSTRSIFLPSFAALLVMVFQAALGRLVVQRGLEGRLVVLHFATALILLGSVTAAAVGTFAPRGGRMSRLAWEAALIAAGAFGVAILGAVVVQARASLAFPDWPLMGGSIAPPSGSSLRTIHYLHRAAALALGAGLVYLVVRAMRHGRDRVVTAFSHAALTLWVLQVIAGAANVLSRLAAWAVVAHVVLGALLWGCTLAAALIAFRRSPSAGRHGDPVSTGTGAAARAKAYFMLTKPRVIELLLITTVPAMMAARRGWPSLALIGATLLGGAACAGGANAINCYFDRDIDERMERTASRPLPAHRVEPARALAFGIFLAAGGFAWLWATTNLLAAALAESAVFFYVFVYTLWLKRSTPSNIVIGGAAGAVPVLVGWAAVRGRVEIPALVLFAIIFFWTPPHFWALALRYRDDYAAAGVPMLPVARGVAETTRHCVFYSFVLVGVSLLLYPAGHMGNLYLVLAAGLGAGFISRAIKLRRQPDPQSAMSVFRWSITYLTLLFVGVAVDRLLQVPGTPSLAGPVFIAGAALFLVFEGAILATVLAGRLPRPGPALAVTNPLKEVVWTLAPAVMAGMMFVASGRHLIRG